MGRTNFRVDIARQISMYLSGKLMLDELVTARISLDEVNQGFDDMRHARGLRSVITFE